MEADVREAVGRAVRTLRVAKGMTQRELGMLTGAGQTGISAVERGERRLDDIHLFALIADHLGMSRVGLFTVVARALPPAKRRGGTPQEEPPEYPDEVRTEHSTVTGEEA